MLVSERYIQKTYAFAETRFLTTDDTQNIHQRKYQIKGQFQVQEENCEVHCILSSDNNDTSSKLWELFHG